MTSPTVRRRELAVRLRELRLAAGLKLEEAGQFIEVSAATMSRIENGARPPSARDVRDLCAAYGADDAVSRQLGSLVVESQKRGWWEEDTDIDDSYATLIGYEAAATAISEYRGSTVPGLLQTPGYLDAYIREAINPGRPQPFSADELQKRLDVTLRRQSSVIDNPAVQYTVYLDEGVVRRPVGGPEVMAEELDHLIRVQGNPNVTIRVVPFSAGAHPGQPGGFTYLSIGQGLISDVVYIDSLAGQIFLEGRADTAIHALVLAGLASKALSAAATTQLLHAQIRRWRDRPDAGPAADGDDDA